MQLVSFPLWRPVACHRLPHLLRQLRRHYMVA